MPISPEIRTLLLTTVGYSGELGAAINSAKGDYATLLGGLRAAQSSPDMTEGEAAAYQHLVNYAKMVYGALDIDWWKVRLGESDFTGMEFDALTQYLAGQVYSIPVAETPRMAMGVELVNAD